MRVTTCDSDETLRAAAVLFDEYRRHYGQPVEGGERTHGWLTRMVDSGMLTVFTVAEDPPGEGLPVGLATAHVVPASLVMGTFWQLRDLYVQPGARRRGAAAALVGAVRAAARSAGATRLSLVTEHDNDAALRLYRGLGLQPVVGLATLSVDL